MRRFLAVVLLATTFSVLLGYLIAVVYVLNLDIETVPQRPFPDPTPIEQDATAGL